MFNDYISFGFAQERAISTAIRTHPALAVVRARVPEYWDAVRARANGMAHASWRGSQPLTRHAHPEAWEAIAEALAPFGIACAFSPVAIGTEADSYRDVVFWPDGDRLIVGLPRALLSRLRGRELAAAIGHGLGHFLLRQDDDPDLAVLLALVRLEEVPDEGRADELWDDPACADLLIKAAALAQLQDLSADRISLLVVRDVDTVLRSIARAFADAEVVLAHRPRPDVHRLPAVEFSLERAPQPHPGFPYRVLLLDAFAASALYRGAIGLTGGLTADELAQRLIIRLPREAGYFRGRADDLDDLILELILMDWLIAAGHRPRPKAARMIVRYLPPGSYEQIIERYDALSDDADQDKDLWPWLQRSAQKSSAWKTAMIGRFIYLNSLDWRLDDQALGEISALAVAMGAQEECRLLFTGRFGYDPFSWLPLRQEVFLQ